MKCRYFLHALAIISTSAILLLLYLGTSLQTVIERSPVYVALLSVTAIALADFRGKAKKHVQQSSLPALDPEDEVFRHMDGGAMDEMQPRDRTSTHPSSISLSQGGRSSPRSSWDPQVLRFFRPSHVATNSIPEYEVQSEPLCSTVLEPSNHCSYLTPEND